MRRPQQSLTVLAERLCRPQRIGIFGHRGVGKTTLLTMLYREAVGGRLQGLRLAAADTRTAEYLADKILQLESGRPLPGTLAETELRFHLYQGAGQFELLFKDYQGEHIELGQEGPIWEFLRDCDAVWLCVDAGNLAEPADCLRCQQEIETLLEQYLAAEPVPTLQRPIALVLTKADLLPLDQWADGREQWADTLGMTRHALATHCPNSSLFAISSLHEEKAKGEREKAKGPEVSSLPPLPLSPFAFALSPLNLEAPLLWLAGALQVQDEVRLGKLASLPGGKVSCLCRGLEAFARRYPDAPATAVFREQLNRRRRRRVLLKGLAGAVAALCLVAGGWAYDVLGYRQAERFQADHENEPALVLKQWESYQRWHPTRNWLRPAAAQAEEGRLRHLGQEVRQQDLAARLARLQSQGADPDADPEMVWQQFHAFQNDFPESVSPGLEPLRNRIKARRDEEVARRAHQAYDDLVGTEQKAADLILLVGQADQFLHDFPDSAQETDVRRRRVAYLQRLDERDIETARDFSAREPFNFPERCAKYQHYLDRHSGSGVFLSEAEGALRTIQADRDKRDYRAVRDQFETDAGNISALVTLAQTYLAVHPDGKYRDATADLLRWTQDISTPRPYRVVLRNGQFDKNLGHLWGKAPDLSVELEVNGVVYGPSNIVAARFDPEWNYEFPRGIVWKVGQPVRILVTDHRWKDRLVLDLHSSEGEHLGMQLLSSDINSGATRLTFESDFRLPSLPFAE